MLNVNQTIKECQLSTKQSKDVKCQPDNQRMPNVNHLIKTTFKIELNVQSSTLYETKIPRETSLQK